ncbi:hypothetical protein K402DRAFT_420322 [Aulographum hederae CBS 113979]|uniref:Monopolin complex subunit Csm1/Pcs1 C-terminal domain-containing protein n=1 Tax=Aulographum hederae CBS 113979 TaxID=1176131 RepID=A0A6G1H2T5_9PEZI|nr:hypothetical protein K402DRAFT_420322 [Aulographum hederae CBS 113979]
MPRAAPATLSRYLDAISDDEDDFAHDNDTLLTPDSDHENAKQARRGGDRAVAASKTAVKGKGATAAVGKAQASKVVKKAAPRRTSGAGLRATTTTKRKMAPAEKKKRSALGERKAPNESHSDTEEFDEFEDEPAAGKKGSKARDEDEMDEDAPVKPKKRGRPATKKTTAAEAAAEKKAKAAEAAAEKKAKAAAKRKVERDVIPETQPEPMEVDQEVTEYAAEELVYEEKMPKPMAKSTYMAPPPPPARAVSQSRSSSRQPGPLAMHRRAGSASDTERDPALRRKLGEMTKRFENMELKYRDMREVAMSDAQTNFEKLRKTSEQRAKDQDDLIASLKKELAHQRSLNSDSKSVHSKLSTLQSENARLASDSSRQTAENKTLSSSLLAAQNESKALAAKLAAAKAAAETKAAIVPGSAKKGRGKDAGGAAAQEAATLKLKEELYSDLTGLMVRGVKHLEEEDLYDCIQTGRNGTLHFHLSVSTLPPSAAQTPNPSGNAFDDAEFFYKPLLDEKNDQELMEILPDYLQEEICFPRSSAGRFYEKIYECMVKRVEIVDVE